MTANEEERIDAMVRATLVAMLEWMDVETTIQNVYEFAVKKLDFPVSLEEVEGALQRKLRVELRAFPFEELGEEAQHAIRQTMIGEHIVDMPELRQVAWEACGYTSLQAIHRVLYEYGGPDLLYE